MVTINRNIKCSTIDDLLEVLKSEAPEEDKIICLRDVGREHKAVIDKYREYMENLERSIKEVEKRKKELEHILKLEENKENNGKYLEDAAVGLIFGMPLMYLSYTVFSHALSPVNKYGILTGMFIGGLLGLFGSIFLYDAFEDIKNYIKAKNIEYKRGKVNIEELRKELSRLEKDLNKKKELYSLLNDYYKEIFGYR